MDGQLGRQRAASIPAPITFPPASTFAVNYNSSSYQNARNADGVTKVMPQCTVRVDVIESSLRGDSLGDGL